MVATLVEPLSAAVALGLVAAPEPLKMEQATGRLGASPPPPPGLEDVSPLAPSEASRRSSPSGLAPGALSPTAYEANEPVKLARTAGGCLVVTLVDGMLATVSDSKTSGTPAAETGSPSTASGGQSPVSAPENEVVEEAPTKKKKSRFCKAKRDHYRRLVEQLVQNLREDPSNFSLDGVRLPRSIAMCRESKDKLLATVMRFAAGNGEVDA